MDDQGWWPCAACGKKVFRGLGIGWLERAATGWRVRHEVRGVCADHRAPVARALHHARGGALAHSGPAPVRPQTVARWREQAADELLADAAGR